MLIVGPRGIAGHEGGIEKFAEQFIRRIPSDIDVDVICLHDDGEKPDHVNLIAVPRSRFMKTDKIFSLVYALWYYATRRYDRVLILGMNLGILIAAMKAMVWRRGKIYLRSGSVDYALDKWGTVARFVMRAGEKAMGMADGLIAVSPSIQKHLQSVGLQSTLIPNGLEMIPPPALETRLKNSVIAVGRVTAQKNYATLVAAAAALHGDCPDIIIAGGADLSDEARHLRDAIARLPEPRVRLIGARPRAEILDMLARHSLYVNCSLHEGMSNAIIEAVQQGIPVIMSDIEANRDLAMPDHFYFPVSDPQALAEKIRTALSHPQDYVIPASRFADWDTVSRAVLEKLELPARGL